MVKVLPVPALASSTVTPVGSGPQTSKRRHGLSRGHRWTSSSHESRPSHSRRAKRPKRLASSAAAPSPPSSAGRGLEHLRRRSGRPPRTSRCSGSLSSLSNFQLDLPRAARPAGHGIPAGRRPLRHRRPTSRSTAAAARACPGRRARPAPRGDDATGGARSPSKAAMRAIVTGAARRPRPTVAASNGRSGVGGGEGQQPDPGRQPVLRRRAGSRSRCAAGRRSRRARCRPASGRRAAAG